MLYVNNNIFNLETSGNIPEKIKVKHVNLRSRPSVNRGLAKWASTLWDNPCQKTYREDTSMKAKGSV